MAKGSGASSKMQRANLQFGTYRSRRACVHSTRTEMQRLPSKEILPRQGAPKSAGQTISSTDQANDRNARVCISPRQDSARTIICTLARDVDFATAETRLLEGVRFFATRNSHRSVSIHALPGNLACFPAAMA